MDCLETYLLEERKLSPVVAGRILEKLRRHPDIAAELEDWIAHRVYDADHPVTVEGYTAADIVRLAPFLDGVGVFTFLVSLREQPQRAKAQIAAGFPRK